METGWFCIMSQLIRYNEPVSEYMVGLGILCHSMGLCLK